MTAAPAPGEVPDLFAALLDDAAVYPPAEAPLPAALAEHRAHFRSWYSAVLGPLVVPAASVDALLVELDSTGAEDGPLGVSLTARAGDQDALERVAVAAADQRLRVHALEVAVPADALDELSRLAAHVPSGAVLYAEPHSLLGLADLAVVLDLGEVPTRVKLRTGGTDASAFPTDGHLASAITACVGRGMSFKCTAGLHHAVRHRDPTTGFEHHGFLNVLLAVDAAVEGADVAIVADRLALRDADAVTSEVADLSPAAGDAVRQAFASLGTCSITEPIEDLVSLGLLARATEPG